MKLPLVQDCSEKNACVFVWVNMSESTPERMPSASAAPADLQVSKVRMQLNVPLVHECLLKCELHQKHTSAPCRCVFLCVCLIFSWWQGWHKHLRIHMALKLPPPGQELKKQKTRFSLTLLILFYSLHCSTFVSSSLYCCHPSSLEGEWMTCLHTVPALSGEEDENGKAHRSFCFRVENKPQRQRKVGCWIL